MPNADPDKPGPGRPSKGKSEKRVTFGISVAPETEAFLTRVAGSNANRGLVVDKLVGLIDVIAVAAAHEIGRKKPQKYSRESEEAAVESTGSGVDADA